MGNKKNRRLRMKAEKAAANAQLAGSDTRSNDDVENIVITNLSVNKSTASPETAIESLAGNGLMKLPDEALLRLLSYLDVFALIRLEAVNRRLNKLIVSNADKLQTLERYIFWISITKKPTYICLHGMEDMEENTRLGDVYSLTSSQLHRRAPRHEVKLESVTFRLTNFTKTLKKPLIFVEALQTAHTAALSKLFAVLFRHVRPFYVHTNISTTVFRDLAPVFPKSVVGLFFKSEGEPAKEKELLQAIEQLPNLKDFAAEPQFKMSLNFYAHPQIRNMTRFRYAGPQYQHQMEEHYRMVAARQRGREYIPQILRQCINDDVLAAVKWEEGEVWNVNASAAGLRQVLIDWLKKKREFKKFQMKLAEFKSIQSEDVTRGLPILERGMLGRVILERKEDKARLQVLFLPDMNRMGFPGMSLEEYDRVDMIYLERLC